MGEGQAPGDGEQNSLLEESQPAMSRESQLQGTLPGREQEAREGDDQVGTWKGWMRNASAWSCLTRFPGMWGNHASASSARCEERK